MQGRNVLWGVICGGLVGALLGAGTADAQPFPGGLPQCRRALATCHATLGTCPEDLTTCEADLAECEAQPHAVFPGDGASSGPALRYTDNGDGTATDNNTLLMWEVKTAVAGSVHNVNNPYTWSSSGSAPDGTLFTDFLDTLNTSPCFAGHCDWRVPNVKELQSIVDYGENTPAIDPSFPGPTAASVYWASTANAGNPSDAWVVGFSIGFVSSATKFNNFLARAVRGGQ
jgi:Protein of unknown function (DUF1566)